MKHIFASLILMVCASAYGRGSGGVVTVVSYDIMRHWIEDTVPSNSIPEDERIFVSRGDDCPASREIIRFHSGMSLKAVAQQLVLTNVTGITLMIATHAGGARVVKPAMQPIPDLAINPEDMVVVFQKPPHFEPPNTALEPTPTALFSQSDVGILRFLGFGEPVASRRGSAFVR